MLRTPRTRFAAIKYLEKKIPRDLEQVRTMRERDKEKKAKRLEEKAAQRVFKGG